MCEVTDNYRTKDGKANFTFGFIKTAEGYYDIDILSSPSYGNRSSGLHPTHRLHSDRGGFKICFGNPSVAKTLGGAKSWAKEWSEASWDYIKTGRTF